MDTTLQSAHFTQTWNSLPIPARTKPSVTIFRLEVRMGIFTDGNGIPTKIPRALILLKTWRYISRLLTYLLT